ncbi:hypothetical protein [Herbaspirillum rhizosphaerae]|uniref:hypothetical protein n=1 Tax=Herbaspirillum rhizosphaerae TaxID=346179 RepID=UPI00067DCB7A|nr:hypothetical protein [Herbaspirillum rhizosphaerae]
MEYEISFAGVGLIFLDLLMLWACWMVRKHLTLMEHEEERDEQEQVRYLQRLLMLTGDRSRSGKDAGELQAIDERP